MARPQTVQLPVTRLTHPFPLNLTLVVHDSSAASVVSQFPFCPLFQLVRHLPMFPLRLGLSPPNSQNLVRSQTVQFPMINLPNLTAAVVVHRSPRCPLFPPVHPLLTSPLQTDLFPANSPNSVQSRMGQSPMIKLETLSITPVAVMSSTLIPLPPPVHPPLISPLRMVLSPLDFPSPSPAQSQTAQSPMINLTEPTQTPLAVTFQSTLILLSLPVLPPLMSPLRTDLSPPGSPSPVVHHQPDSPSPTARSPMGQTEVTTPSEVLR